MKSHRRLGRQQGMSLLGMVFVAIMVAGVVFIGFQIVPIYLENSNITRAVESVKDKINSPQTSITEVKRFIASQFSIDYISVIEANDLKVRKNSGKILVDVTYEDRRPLFYNLEVVANFNKEIQVFP